jgi:hypothetical protein
MSCESAIPYTVYTVQVPSRTPARGLGVDSTVLYDWTGAMPLSENGRHAKRQRAPTHTQGSCSMSLQCTYESPVPHARNALPLLQ